MSTNFPPMYSDPVVTIGSMCYQSYPCQHFVNYDNKWQLMSATEIVELFRKLKKPIPDHFMYALDAL